jgi:hypothetical protein
MPLLLSLFMTSVVSLISTYTRRGASCRTSGTPGSAPGAGRGSSPFPAVRVVLPLVRRLTAMFVDMRSP